LKKLSIINLLKMIYFNSLLIYKLYQEKQFSHFLFNKTFILESNINSISFVKVYQFDLLFNEKTKIFLLLILFMNKENYNKDSK
jgi:hypothetical protein